MQAENYRKKIAQLIAASPFDIDTELVIVSRTPTMASSEFLTNKEQGDWAEQIVLDAINENSSDFVAVPYGRSDSLGAGDPGFAQFYQEYQDELNEIGKKPDILIFKRDNMPNINLLSNNSVAEVSKAVAAIEVRSSSFLADKYSEFMANRTENAENECLRIKELILTEPLSGALQQKSPEIHDLIANATSTTFHELNFRGRNWSSSDILCRLSNNLRLLKEQIKILHKRDYLSITPKVEDLVLVNRWIQSFGVKHFYLQVFFDKAYVISFQDILRISADSEKEDVIFSIERDVKNQRKTTIKVDIKVGQEILGRIDMPAHESAMKELDRGRLLFYVTFKGGKGYLDMDIFNQEIIGD